MSQPATRSAAFLQEMGIGVQWKLRHGGAVEPEADAFVTAVQALADGVPAEKVPTPVSAPVVHAAAAVAPPASPLQAQAAAHSAPPAEPAPSAAAPADVDPAAEDTAWFDDAPVPPVAPRPASAPTRPAPAAPARPAASSPARSAPRAAAPADADPASEDMAWFDNAPVPPVAPMPSAAASSRAAVTSQPSADELPATPLSDEAIAAMDWPALQAAVSSCTRCTLCETRVAAVNGRGAQQATWIAIAPAPSEADEQEAQAVTGEAGVLLHNMLKAIELKPDADVYITNVVKCRPPGRNPTGEEVLACRPYLDRELALTGATMAMTFGQFAARGLMMGPAARGKVMHYGASKLPVVATYHPEDLLRKPEDKAKAWADLCLAKTSHA